MALDKKDEGAHLSIMQSKDWSVGSTSKLIAPSHEELPPSSVASRFHSSNPFSVWYAVKHNHLERVKELVEKRGTSLEHRDMDGGRTPLHWACKYDRMDIVDWLLEKGADIDSIDAEGNTPLHYLAGFSSAPAMILRFLDLDVTFNSLNNANETPIDMAQRLGKPLHARIIDKFIPRPELLVVPPPAPEDVDPIEVKATGEETELESLARRLAIKRHRLGDMHRSLVPTLTRLSRLFRQADDVDSCRDCLEHRVKICEIEAAKEDKDLSGMGAGAGGGSRSSLLAASSSSVVDGGGSPGAASTMSSASDMGAAVHGKWRKELAAAYQDLGHVLVEQKSYRDAQARLSKAVEILEHLHGPRHLKVTDAANLLATCHCERGLLASSRMLWRRSAEVMQEAHGEVHPDLAATWNNLGQAHLLSHQYEDAISAFQNAVAAGQPLYGNPPELTLATYYENLAKSHMEAMNPSPAIETSLRHALEIRMLLLGEDHEDVWQSRRNLGVAVCEVRHLSGLAAAGLNTIGMEQGQPDLPPSDSLASLSLADGGGGGGERRTGRDGGDGGGVGVGAGSATLGEPSSELSASSFDMSRSRLLEGSKEH